MGIRTKIMLGFVILASMMFISGAISIFEITKLGRSVKGLIRDNYWSIDYSRQMLDAIEKQENAMLYFAHGDKVMAFEDFIREEKVFLASLDSASKNLTLRNEISFIDSVRYYYSSFQALSAEVFRQERLTLEDYLVSIKPLVFHTNKHVKNLITINQQGLFKTATFLETSAQRAVIPGLIVIVTSLIFTFVFTYLVHHYFVSPIIALTKGINDYVRYKKNFDVLLETRDEIWKLKESIVSLISICKSVNKKTE